jgi:hypothetical protein
MSTTNLRARAARLVLQAFPEFMLKSMLTILNSSQRCQTMTGTHPDQGDRFIEALFERSHCLEMSFMSEERPVQEVGDNPLQTGDAQDLLPWIGQSMMICYIENLRSACTE